MPLQALPRETADAKPHVGHPRARRIEPPVLYFGTPVALLSTLRPDGGANLTPMSSAWALGDRIFLGLADASQGSENLRSSLECVINLPDARLWSAVEAIGRVTGRRDVPLHKQAMGYRYEPDHFQRAGLTRIPSERVKPPRVAECPLQLEARLLSHHAATALPNEDEPGFRVLEVQVLAVHAHESILHADSDRIDAGLWHPLLYVFRHYVGGGAPLGRNFRA